jgi:hypothetical protein
MHSTYYKEPLAALKSFLAQQLGPLTPRRMGDYGTQVRDGRVLKGMAGRECHNQRQRPNGVLRRFSRAPVEVRLNLLCLI